MSVRLSQQEGTGKATQMDFHQSDWSKSADISHYGTRAFCCERHSVRLRPGVTTVVVETSSADMFLFRNVKCESWLDED